RPASWPTRGACDAVVCAWRGNTFALETLIINGYQSSHEATLWRWSGIALALHSTGVNGYALCAVPYRDVAAHPSHHQAVVRRQNVPPRSSRWAYLRPL